MSKEKKYEVTEEFLLNAYKEACPEWKKKMEKEFPGAFNSEYHFGDEYTIDTSLNDGPMVIGNGWAPEHLKFKCLVVKNEWKAIFIDNPNSNGRQTIVFKRRVDQ
jgi:hypothetical protein